MTVAQPQFLAQPLGYLLYLARPAILRAVSYTLRCTACFAISICRPVAEFWVWRARRCLVINLSDKSEKSSVSMPPKVNLKTVFGSISARCWIISRWTCTAPKAQNMASHLSDRGERHLIHYLSTSPSLYGDICRGLKSVGLAGAQA